MASGRNNRVVILNGSPRRQGNTAVVRGWLEAALKKRGLAIERYDLYWLSVLGCAHCDHCKHFQKEPACRLRDPFRPVLDRLVRARAIVVASPVYCWSVSGCTGAALDRFYSLFKDRGCLFAGKKLAGVFTAGGDAFDGMDLCVDMLKRICDYGQAEYAGTLAGGNCDRPSDTRRRKDLKKAAEDLAAAL
jgi:multimeric flavodoxin WrbA